MLEMRNLNLKQGKFAWMTGLDDELRMIRAMKKANRAQVIGKSSRGNKTKDTYSLMVLLMLTTLQEKIVKINK